MANYFVIGGDTKEYGPVSETDVRQWISEGRLSADSRVKAENDAEFRALAQFPEFASAFSSHAAAASPAQTAEDFLGRDYELDIGGCISRGFELYKGHFGIIFGSFIIMLLVQAACWGALGLIRLPFNEALLHAPAAFRAAYEYLSASALSLVIGPILGGLFLVYLKTLRGEPTGVGEVFAGFQRAFKDLFLGSLIVSLVTGACMLPFQYVIQSRTGPLLEQMQHLQGDPTALQNIMPQLLSAFTSSLPLLVVCMLPVMFFSVSWQFTLPLIIDKQLTFRQALGTSWHVVMKHWWVVFGLTVLAGLLTLLGVLACCIGLLFTAPLGMAVLVVAYESIFGRQKS